MKTHVLVIALAAILFPSLKVADRTELNVAEIVNSESFYSDVIEDDLEIENWMIDDDSWRKNNKIVSVEEFEDTLKIERWMTDDQLWVH